MKPLTYDQRCNPDWPAHYEQTLGPIRAGDLYWDKILRRWTEYPAHRVGTHPRYMEVAIRPIS